MKLNQNAVLVIVFTALVVVVLGIFFIANSSGGAGGGGGGDDVAGGGGGSSAANGSSGGSAEWNSEAIEYKDGTTKVQPTQEETERITKIAQKTIDNDYPEYKGVVPTIAVLEEDNQRTISATYINTPVVLEGNLVIDRVLVISLYPNGKVGVAVSG